MELVLEIDTLPADIKPPAPPQAISRLAHAAYHTENYASHLLSHRCIAVFSAPSIPWDVLCSHTIQQQVPFAWRWALVFHCEKILMFDTPNTPNEQAIVSEFDTMIFCAPCGTAGGDAIK